MGQSRRWTKIQTDRVLLSIFAKGLLTQREMRVALWVIARSWGEGSKDEPRNRTRAGTAASTIAAEVEMDGRDTRRTVLDMIEAKILIRHDDGGLEFNEHFDSWERGKSTREERVKSPRPERGKLPRGETPRAGQITPGGGVNRPGLRGKSPRSLHIPSDTPDTIQTPSAPSAKTRPPTIAEKHFMDGFKKRYGHEPSIDKNNAIKLAGKVGQHGIELVSAKIDAWWESPAGRWADKSGARTIGAFIRSFDEIVTNGFGGSLPDFSRFDLAGKSKPGT